MITVSKEKGTDDLSRDSRRGRGVKIALPLIALFLAFSAFLMSGGDISKIPQTLTEIFSQTEEGRHNAPVGEEALALSEIPPWEPGELQIHYLDVGQGDSCLARLPNGETMMIDGGNNPDGEKIAAYLKEAGIQKIDYLIGTHPHEDHIGGLDVILRSFDIGEIYLPEIAGALVPTTKTYEDVLDAISEKGLRAVKAKAGVQILREEELSIRILSPASSDYDDLNDYSAVVKITFGEKSFLFMGDAETQVEEELLSGEEILSADVIKLGHHGSSTSSSPAFLERVNPDTAVISCGKDNSYGHPHSEVLDRLDEEGISYFRTDLDGTVIASCNGEEIDFQLLSVSCDGNSIN